MKTYPEAPHLQQDSVAYKLLNITGCLDRPSQEKLYLSYHKASEHANVDSKILYSELNTAYPGMTDVIHNQYKDKLFSHDPNPQWLKVMASFVFDSYYDFKIAGWATSKFPYFVNITKMRCAPTDDFFVITGQSYTVESRDGSVRLFVEMNPQMEQLVPACVINTMWPDSANHIVSMEALLYSPEDIAQAILNGTTISSGEGELVLPSFI